MEKLAELLTTWYFWVGLICFCLALAIIGYVKNRNLDKKIRDLDKRY